MTGQRAPSPSTIVGNLAAGVRDFGDRTLVTCGSESLSYRSFAERVEGVVADLADAGVRRGDRVALCSTNRIESALLIWACARGGFLFVGLPTNMAPEGWGRLVADARPTLTLAAAGFVEQVPRALALATVLTGRRLPWDTSADEPDEDDVYALVYTSGTTGTPKGAKITHRAAMHVAEFYRNLLDLHPGDVTPIHLPFSYVSGHVSQLNPIMLAGGSSVIMAGFSARSLISTARAAEATLFDLVPWMFTMLLREPDFTPERLPKLRAVIFGGAPMPEEVRDAVHERFPRLQLFDVYGMSETAGLISFHDARQPGDTAGRPVDGIRVRVGEGGEILVRGPLVTPGYWADPAATARVLQNGWLHTGDRGSITADGEIRLRGRMVDLINRGGVKIAPDDVERALRKHPAVADAAVFGVPDGAAGDAVAAAVVIREGEAVTAGELQAWVRPLLPPHARPHTVRFLTQLPRNPTGKIDRAALRKSH